MESTRKVGASDAMFVHFIPHTISTSLMQLLYSRLPLCYVLLHEEAIHKKQEVCNIKSNADFDVHYPSKSPPVDKTSMK